MENARVMIVDDNVWERRLVGKALVGSGHEVVHETDSLNSTLNALEDIRDGRLECDAIVLDGNLDRTSRHCADAKIVASLARAYELNVKLIGHSTYDMLAMGVELDSDPGKHQTHLLPEVLDNL